jgi:2-polyprenyl-3-methyl-5-hydroxy-6-metoxy-1,4-benzoquinol methylase
MRNTKRIVYGSSYDRGLEHLLKMWPDVKKEVPDAELHVFYGWNLYDVMAKGNPQMQEWKEKMNKLMEQPGITHLGRISHEAVQKEFESAGIWAYPTHFGEISCITAMKAQAYGAIPVVINYAALQETVQFGWKIDGDIYDEEAQEEFKLHLIGTLKEGDAPLQEKKRTEMTSWAREKFAWSNVAKQWHGEFKSEVSLEKQVEELMEHNQALKAWDLVKDTDTPLRHRVYLRVKHAFNEEDYKKYYSEELIENPVPEEIALDCTKLAPRFAWVVDEILKMKPERVVDFGCADGYLCHTLASKGIFCYGVNLYNPSVEFARERSKKLGLETKTVFLNLDLLRISKTVFGGNVPVIVMMEVLEHLPDPRKAIEHAMSLLNDGGSLFLSTPRVDHIGVEQHLAEANKEGWDDGKPAGHLRLFTEEEFKDLLKGYTVKQFLVDEDRCMLAEVTK